jgi:hypothetical protein
MKADWRPFFWEPVDATGERIMAGVVLRFDGQWIAQRMLRDDVLDALYGRASANPIRLIDHALEVCLSIARAGDLDAFKALSPMMGLHPGPMRTTDALTLGEALRHVVLMHSSLAQLDGWEELEESEAPGAEEVNKRFSTEVREAVTQLRPELAQNFGRTARLIDHGRPLRFGYLSSKAVIHFSVLHAARQNPSVRDARARLWELSRAKEVAGLEHAALITWMPPDDEPTVGPKQREALRINRDEIEREADAHDKKLRFHAVTSIDAARAKVMATVE